MGIENMGGIIATLRKERNVTQEELAENVGVSAQAVSKWENGGAPDSALLPAIADFFGVSVDALFGRSVTDYSGLYEAIEKKIADTPCDEQLSMIDSLCGVMQTALFGGAKGFMRSVTEHREEVGDGFGYSEYHGVDGYTMAGLDPKLPFFMFLPKTPALSDFNVSTDDFCAFFDALSDPSVFKAFVWFTKCDSKKITAKGLMAELNISEEKTSEVLNVLMKYCYLISEDIEIDDIVHTVYNCPHTTPAAFAPMLLMARRIIKGSNWFYGFRGNDAPCLL